MKRIISSILALLTVFASAAMLLPQTVAAESLYVRKIVSVVYDDSSSMYDPVNTDAGLIPQKKWAYASYAMQAFCGMLNSEDQLYITYMSDIRDGVKPANPAPVDLKDDIEDSVSDIKDRSERDGRGTPYYVHNGLVIDTYDLKHLEEIAAAAAKGGGSVFTFKCSSSNAFEEAKANLWGRGSDWEKLMKIYAKASGDRKKYSGCTYSHDPGMRIITIYFTEK